MKRVICYKTSRDYKRLKALLEAGYEVVCFTTYDWGSGYEVTDVCRARFDGERYQISARGIEYCCYWAGMHRYKSFEDACEQSKIEFIEPTITKEENETKEGK